MKGLFILTVIAMALALIAFLTGVERPLGLDLATIVPALAVLCFATLIGSSVLAEYQGKLGAGVKALLIWILMGLVLMIGYTYRAELFGVAP